MTITSSLCSPTAQYSVQLLGASRACNQRKQEDKTGRRHTHLTSECHYSLHDFDKSYLKGFAEVPPQNKRHTEIIHQLLLHKCGGILDILI